MGVLYWEGGLLCCERAGSEVVLRVELLSYCIDSVVRIVCLNGICCKLICKIIELGKESYANCGVIELND